VHKSFIQSWGWLLSLYTAAAFLENFFWGQLTAFTPIFLRDLGVSGTGIAYWTGLITAVASAAGLPFLPFWGALADRYSRKPIIVRSYIAYLLSATIAALVQNVWGFMAGRAILSLSLGNSGLMMTTLTERTPTNRRGFAFGPMNVLLPLEHSWVRCSGDRSWINMAFEHCSSSTLPFY
jgi:MFS transporter, DHA1 family, multidrug resistance protein